ncbi:MAG: NUDIX hydrolase [Planctomycetes bacterium]|nr:NUDIX hydrolase [Planctomycetota bacterium]
MPSRKLLFRAKRFDVEEVQEQLEGGQLLSRHVVRHPGAVVVLPLVDPQHICMIHTYRVAIDKWQLELPAGTLDKGLPASEMAHLELMEETGYRAGVMTHVHTFAMSPGILDEKMHFYVARDLTPGETQRELGEQMSNRILSWSEVDRQLRDGNIIDAKTLVGLLWHMRYREHA